MEQNPNVRPMSREENAAYRGVTVEEDGAEARGEEHAGAGGAYGEAHRSSVRYVRIGGAPQRSLLGSILWAVIIAALLSFFIFVALPAIAMVVIGVCVLGAVISLIGRGRVLAWLTRHLYGR